MPINPDVLAEFKLKGACVSVGKEAWWISGKKLKTGIISKVLVGKIEVKTAGDKQVLNPHDIFLTTTKGKGMEK